MNIKIYSALAASIVSLKNSSDAQVIYTDIPDTTIGAIDSQFSVDLNNDGISELTIKLQGEDSANSTASGGFSNIHERRLYATPNPDNGVLGNSWNEVSALQFNDSINSNSPWLNNDQFEMASWYFKWHQHYDDGQTSTWSSGNGAWFGNSGDRYLGVRFKSGGETYYGWVRLYVQSEWLQVTLKDYAYEATPDTEIFAGQNFATGINAIGESAVIIYSLPDKSIEIHLNSEKYINGKVTVTNISGQSVAAFNVIDLLTTYSLNGVPSGEYCVSISKDGKQFNKVIVLY